MEDKYIRKVQTSVTNFIHCGDYYLFIERNKDKVVDPGKVNGIGGRLEAGENYLDAAIRETIEETGYSITNKDIKFCGMVKLQGGFPEDWVIAFFKTSVSTMEIPKQHELDNGKLIWIHKDEVLKTDKDLVEDIYYCFEDIVQGDNHFFATFVLNDDQKIVDSSISKLEFK